MGPKSQLTGFLSLESIEGSDPEIAAIHETNRQSTVKEILVHIFFLSKFNKIQPSLTVEAAESQYFYATGDDQAAHCVPGQVLFNGVTIQRLITTNDVLELGLENLFGRTDGLHGKFNKADSRAEENGLRSTMADVCNFVALRAKNYRFQRAEQVFPIIDSAFGTYKARGVQAFNAAIAKQQSMTTPLQGVTRPELIAILEAYRDQLSTAIPSVESVQGIGLEAERIWRAYRFL
jgi:hypothetical protein